jgi:disks large protein 1
LRVDSGECRKRNITKTVILPLAALSTIHSQLSTCHCPCRGENRKTKIPRIDYEVCENTPEFCENTREFCENTPEFCENTREFCKNTREFCEISRDIGGISRDIGGISRESGGISRDIAPISRDIGAISRDIGGISRDIGVISRDIGVISRDIYEKSPVFLFASGIIPFWQYPAGEHLPLSILHALLDLLNIPRITATHNLHRINTIIHLFLVISIILFFLMI